MTDIFFLDTSLAASAPMQDLIQRRRVSVASGVSLDGVKARTLVCSEAGEASLGGQKGLIDVVRSIGARQIVVISENAPAFDVTEDLGGRLLRIALPAAASRPLADGALMLAVDMIAAPYADMVAADAASSALIDMAARVAAFPVGVFINGPSGSGKEVLARTIHARSPRADKAFVAINCAAIPENMLESMLFGHEKGAFTGAHSANKGILREADGGTLLLDEISEMPLGLQAKLLRVLQERKVQPLGSSKEIEIDVRIIATSNRDMEEEVRKGTFREDLFYRLNVFPLETQPLAHRGDDIAVLAQAMLRRHAVAGLPVPLLSAEAIATLTAHTWPGNVRELENVMQRATVLQDGGIVRARDIMLTARASALRPVQAA